MKQITQNARTGKLCIEEVPVPQIGDGEILVKTYASLISSGTERKVVEFAKKTLAGKAKVRPDLVKKVISKAKADGIQATIKSVLTKLDDPIPLGYSAAGKVLAVGSGVEGHFQVDDRVAI